MHHQDQINGIHQILNKMMKKAPTFIFPNLSGNETGILKAEERLWSKVVK